VNLTESGLPSGTMWSVTLHGVQRNSTNATITYSEPNGSYLLFVGSVAGYTVSPEWNVTVNGEPVNLSILFISTSPPSQGCTSFSWDEKNYTFHGNCVGQFETDYRWFNATIGYIFGNSTFELAAVTEIDASGALVALAEPGFQGHGQITVTYSPAEINVTDVIVGNVTTVVGVNSSTGSPNGQTPVWTPDEAPGGGGSTTWGNGRQVLGTTTIGIVFHFDNRSGNRSNMVKFDVSVAGWPWVSPSDELGLALGLTAEQGTHFSYSSANDTIVQQWNANGTVAASLVFGPSANTTGNAPSPLQVSDQVGLIPTGPDATAAVALLTLHGPGGYSGFVYDPWIVFGEARSTVIVSAPSPPGGAALPWSAVAVIAAAAIVLGVVAYRVRRRSVDEGLSPTSWPTAKSTCRALPPRLN